MICRKANQNRVPIKKEKRKSSVRNIKINKTDRVSVNRVSLENNDHLLEIFHLRILY
jgi:hypothetical protein